MYNRYVPQPDGSYRRNRMQEPRPAPPRQPETSRPMPPEPPCEAPAPSYDRPRRKSPPAPAGSFLRQLLPGNLDTEDLLVVVLLLLMAGEGGGDRDQALLTLALYLFL